MVMKNIYIKSIIWGVILQMMFSNFVFAQSQHSFLWNIGNYSLDFSGTEVEKSMLENDI